MFYWSFISVVHFWPPSIFNPGYAYAGPLVSLCNSGVDLSQNMRGQGQSGQAIRLFQAPRKISFTFHFWHTSFIFDDVKLAELSNNGYEWKNVTF